MTTTRTHGQQSNASPPARGRAHSLVAVLTACVFALTGMSIFLAGGATASAPERHQVTICHATTSDSNPYVEETVDVIAGGLQGGHEDHTGQVWNATLKDDHISWGDIIPAFSYDEFTFAGLNATGDGTAILANHCVVPVQPTVATPALATATTPSCEQPSITVTLPADGNGVTYAASGPLTLTSGQSVTITATATTGYTLPQGYTPQTITNTFDPDSCTVEPIVAQIAQATATTPSCEQPSITVTLPADGNGVTYAASGPLTLASGQSVTITATATTGYTLPQGYTPQTITNTFDATTCSGVDSITVSAGTPTVTTPSCDEPNLTVTLPSTTGISYAASGPLTLAPGETVTITPTATSGYTLAEGTRAMTITNRFDSTSCAGVLPVTETHTAVPVTRTSTSGALAATGAGPVRSELAWAFGLVLVGGMLSVAARRNRTTS
jgi:D-lyxose ketol-isomerase